MWHVGKQNANYCSLRSFVHPSGFEKPGAPALLPQAPGLLHLIILRVRTKMHRVDILFRSPALRSELCPSQLLPPSPRFLVINDKFPNTLEPTSSYYSLP